MSTPTIWALTDDRAGHNAHTLGLAQSLGLPFDTKELHFNALAHAPNALLGASLATLGNKDSLAAPYPNLVIASGRRMVPLMRSIKQHSPQTKLIQCLWPGTVEPFDLILAPEHDTLPDDSRIIPYKAALHALTESDLRDAAITFQALFDGYPKPHLGVLIGGHSKHGKATLDDLHHLIDTAELLAGDGTLFITTSRRTPKVFAASIRDRLTGSYYLYEWGDEGANPYRGIQALADALIVSGDSISMIAESCFSGKPVLIDDGFHSMSAKHQRCVASLYAGNHAFPLRADCNYAELQPVALNPWPSIHSALKEYLKKG